MSLSVKEPENSVCVVAVAGGKKVGDRVADIDRVAIINLRIRSTKQENGRLGPLLAPQRRRGLTGQNVTSHR